MPEATQTPTDEEIYQQGLALLRDEKFDQGIEHLHRVCRRLPKALGDLAWAYRMRGKLELAAECLGEFLKHFPDDAHAWMVMAQIARERNAVDQARDCARRAVAAHPADAQVWFDLGEVFLFTHDCNAAVEAYDQCLRINPQFGRAVVRRQLAQRFCGSRLSLFLNRWAWYRRVRDWVVSWDLIATLIELDMGITADDRWQTAPPDWGTTAGLDVEGWQNEGGSQTRNRTALFRQWFESLPLEGRVETGLEIGCGDGELAGSLAGRGFRLLSVTPSEFARRDRQHRGIAAERSDFHSVGKPAGSIDLLIADYILHHSRAPLFALWEWHRLLRPDGYLVLLAHLAVDQPNPRFGSSHEAIETNDPRQAHYVFGSPGHILTLTYWQLRWLIRQAGFQLLAESLADPAHICLESVEHVDGRLPSDTSKPWDLFLLLRKPGRMPYDGTLEKPRSPSHNAGSPEQGQT